MDSKTTLGAPVNQEVIDLVEDTLDTSNPTDVSTAGSVDQCCTPITTLLSAGAQAQGPDESESVLPSAHPPCNAEGNDDDEGEEGEEQEIRREEEAAETSPTESGSLPVGAEGSSSTSSTPMTTTQISPPGLPPPPPPSPQILLPSQIMLPTTNAVARFKPSPRDVISGIAPHVFDERRRRRSSYVSLGRQGSGRRSSSPRWYGYRQGRPRASPLRMSVVISLDDRSIYIGELMVTCVRWLVMVSNLPLPIFIGGLRRRLTYSILCMTEDASSVAARLSVDVGSGKKQQSRSDSKSTSSPSSSPSTPPISPGKKIAAWTKFKLDGAMFKTLVSRMKR